MQIKEIAPFLLDKVCLYRETVDEDKRSNLEYEDIWMGKMGEIPPQFLDYEIRVIGANKGYVDIQVTTEMEMKI